MVNTSSKRGFTLVELVVTIALSTIVVGFMTFFIAGPVASYTDQSRRAELVDLAENSLRRIARDVRRALPNSVRLNASGSTIALELLSTADEHAIGTVHRRAIRRSVYSFRPLTTHLTASAVFATSRSRSHRTVTIFRSITSEFPARMPTNSPT